MMIRRLKEKKKIYKCPDCTRIYRKPRALYKHVEDEHDVNIPDNVTVKQYVFNRKYNKEYSICVICKKEKTPWNEEAGRYDRYCSEKCRLEAGRRAKENMKKKYGKEHLLDDPEQQKKMLEGRKISGKYKFSDGKEIGYVGSYEKDFLEFCDEDLEIKSSEIVECPHIFYYKYDDKKRFYIPDFFIPNFNLIVEIKDGGDNPNKHHKIVEVDHVKDRLKWKAVIDDKRFNFIVITNKDYINFVEMMKTISNNKNSTTENERYYHIPNEKLKD